MLKPMRGERENMFCLIKIGVKDGSSLSFLKLPPRLMWLNPLRWEPLALPYPVLFSLTIGPMTMVKQLGSMRDEDWILVERTPLLENNTTIML